MLASISRPATPLEAAASFLGLAAWNCSRPSTAASSRPGTALLLPGLPTSRPGSARSRVSISVYSPGSSAASISGGDRSAAQPADPLASLKMGGAAFATASVLRRGSTLRNPVAELGVGRGQSLLVFLAIDADRNGKASGAPAAVARRGSRVA
jgi:hypothetical protein